MPQSLPMPDITDHDFIQGGIILSLIEKWSDWVHRRVEYVTLADPQTSERRMSLDFTLAHDPAIRPIDNGGPDNCYLVPVTWIEKHRITRFSLRNEGEGALPVWTQMQTAAVATAALAEAATEVMQSPSDSPTIRARIRPPKPPLVPIDVLQDLWFIASAKPHDAVERWERFIDPPAHLPEPQLDESRRWREAMVADPDFPVLASDFARNFLIMTALIGQPGSRRIIKLSFEEQRIDTTLSQSPSTKRVGKLGAYLRQIERFIGLRPKRIVLPASSVSRAQCYHLEVDVPEGIRLTLARLRAYAPATLIDDHDRNSDTDHYSQELADTVTKNSQCVHLHLANVPKVFTGSGVLALRIGDGLVVRGALINAAFTTALLVLVAAMPETFLHDPAASVAVLLGIPGGISLYLARPREPGMSTSMHAGVRLLAFCNAAVAFGAVVVMLAGGECEVAAKTTQQVCTRWGGAETSLIIFAVLAGLMLVILAFTYIYSRRPPELGSIKSKPSPSDSFG
jgi:hypothetical protein